MDNSIRGRIISAGTRNMGPNSAPQMLVGLVMGNDEEALLSRHQACTGNVRVTVEYGAAVAHIILELVVCCARNTRSATPCKQVLYCTGDMPTEQHELFVRNVERTGHWWLCMRHGNTDRGVRIKCTPKGKVWMKPELHFWQDLTRSHVTTLTLLAETLSSYNQLRRVLRTVPAHP